MQPPNQTTDQASTQNDTNRYDQLVFEVLEHTISREEQVTATTKLFPLFADKPIYDHLLTSQRLRFFAESRGVGMSDPASAHASDISTTLLTKILQGEGLSLERFLEVVKIEVFSAAHTERMQLVTMTVAGAKGDHKAAEIALNNILPYDYGKHKQIEEDTEDNVHMTYSVREPETEE